MMNSARPWGGHLMAAVAQSAEELISRVACRLAIKALNQVTDRLYAGTNHWNNAACFEECVPLVVRAAQPFAPLLCGLVSAVEHQLENRINGIGRGDLVAHEATPKTGVCGGGAGHPVDEHGLPHALVPDNNHSLPLGFREDFFTETLQLALAAYEEWLGKHGQTISSLVVAFLRQ